MASNPTPEAIGELIASGEDLCDGLDQHAVAIGIKQNTFAATRAELDALIAAQAALAAADGAQPAAYAALRSADSNGKGFLARAVKVLSIALGERVERRMAGHRAAGQQGGHPHHAGRALCRPRRTEGLLHRKSREGKCAAQRHRRHRRDALPGRVRRAHRRGQRAHARQAEAHAARHGEGRLPQPLPRDRHRTRAAPRRRRREMV